MKTKLLLLILASFLAFFASPIFAADTMMNADQIKQLVTGKTVTAKHNLKGFNFTVFFDADNKTAFRKQKGSTTKTTYSMNGNMHCIQWKGQNRCANIRDNKDGTYSRINPRGKAIITWSKISEGKTL